MNPKFSTKIDGKAIALTVTVGAKSQTSYVNVYTQYGPLLDNAPEHMKAAKAAVDNFIATHTWQEVGQEYRNGGYVHITV